MSWLWDGCSLVTGDTEYAGGHGGTMAADMDGHTRTHGPPLRPRHCRATLGDGSRPMMPNARAYNPDPMPLQNEKKNVENCNPSNTSQEKKIERPQLNTMEGVGVLRTCNDAKYVTHTGVSPEHPTERRPTRDGRYRQDLYIKTQSNTTPIISSATDPKENKTSGFRE